MQNVPREYPMRLVPFSLSLFLSYTHSLYSLSSSQLPRSAPGDAQTLSPTTKPRENRIHGIHCNLSRRRPLFEITIMITIFNARYTQFCLSLSEYFICHSFPLYFIIIRSTESHRFQTYTSTPFEFHSI